MILQNSVQSYSCIFYNAKMNSFQSINTPCTQPLQTWYNVLQQEERPGSGCETEAEEHRPVIEMWRETQISLKKTILPWQISHDLKILVMYCIYTVYTSLTIFTISCYKIHAQKTDSWNKVPFKFTMGRLPDILTDTKRWPDLTMPLRNLNNRTHSSGIRWGATWKWRISTLTHYKIVHISLQHLISSL